jgi:hypothetical protein
MPTLTGNLNEHSIQIQHILDDTKMKRKVKRIDKKILEEIETLDQNKTEREMKIFRFLFLFFLEPY